MNVLGLKTLLNHVIEYSFYSLFLLVPLAFTDKTSELFEFNKMWLTFGLTLIISSAWIAKMIAQKEIKIQKTPLDIPILIFLLSQILATIFSMDMHVSIWGYYSRFNGGLLSTLSYIILFYALVSNFPLKKEEQIEDQTKNKHKKFNHKIEKPLFTLTLPTMVKRSLLMTLVSGCIVALWGFPSHFGYDPTCLLFRGTLDVSCWTDAFQPKARIFSTMGQPAWLAAYLAALLMIVIGFVLRNSFYEKIKDLKKNISIPLVIYFIISILFYADLLFTNTRGGFLGFWIANIAFWSFLFVKEVEKTKKLILLSILGINSVLIAFFVARSEYILFWFISIIGFLIILPIFNRKWLVHYLTINILFILLTFIAGNPFQEVNKYFSFDIFKNQTTQQSQAPQALQAGTVLETGGTESGSIRKIVWQGALDMWQKNPLFGTGVETFAFGYYKYRPQEHNLTSEWDYLYNKAHNEYLNYLSTTGIFGLGSYLLLIGWFLYVSGKKLYKEKLDSNKENLISIGIIAGYITILVSNFFGFSVVIINLFFFLFPAFVLTNLKLLKEDNLLIIPKPLENAKKPSNITPFQWTGIILIMLFLLFQLFNLIKFWVADINYGLGSNLNKVGQYQEAYPKLIEAVNLRGDEPVFQDELSLATSVLAAAYAQQQMATEAAQLAQQALTTSNKVVESYPNNVVFWKTRVRALYTLSQVDPRFLPLALQALEKAHNLAPTDAKISYNLGVLYGQNGDVEKGIEVLKDTIKLKPDYRDAYFALALFYRDQAIDENGRVVNEEKQQQAEDYLNYILTNFSKNDKQALDTLSSWEK